MSGSPGVPILLEGSEALETGLLQGLNNGPEIHHSLADRRKAAHQAVDVAQMQVHEVALELVDRHRRVFTLQLDPARIEVDPQRGVLNRVPEAQQRAGVGQEGMGMVLDGELQAVGFGPGHAPFDRFHETVPDQVPIESLRDVDMELGRRGAALDFVVPRQIGRRPLQFPGPRRHDVDDRRVEPGGQATSGLEMIQGPFALLAPRTREVFDHRLEHGELGHAQFVPLQLLLQPVHPVVRPKGLEVPARGGDQFDPVEAQPADDVDGRLRVGCRAQTMEVPAYAPELDFARAS